MPTIITETKIRVSKSICERAYEPFAVEFEQTLTNPDGVTTEESGKHYRTLEKMADKIIAERIRDADSRYNPKN